MKLGDLLRKDREEKGMTPDELASRLGISVREYEILEAHGPRSPEDRKLLYRAAQALGSSLPDYGGKVEDDPAHAE